MRAPERRFVGFVAKYMGDGVLVYFGYPQALKDDDGLEPDELKLVIEVVDNRVEHLESGTTLHRLLRQFRNLPVGQPGQPGHHCPALQHGAMANSGARPWDVGAWLRGLGLAQYEASFRENAIDTDILRDLTDQDLEKLGVLLGDRRRLLRAIAALGGTPASTSTPGPDPPPVTSAGSAPTPAAVAPPISSTLEVSGERRYVTVMFCDLVDSTGIAARLDAEEWRELVGGYLDAASAAVAEMGGKVARKLDAHADAVLGGAQGDTTA